MIEYVIVFKDRERESVYISKTHMEGLMTNIYRTSGTFNSIVVSYDSENDEYMVLNMNDVLHISAVTVSNTANYEV